MWVTKDVPGDITGWQDLYASILASSPVGASMAAEMKKIDGLPVLTERTQKMMNSEIKSKETVISIEQKEPDAGLYDVPAGYTQKPYDPMTDMRMGTRGMHSHGR
jgi:hypothetical protein